MQVAPGIVSIADGAWSADIAPAYGCLLLNLRIAERHIISCPDSWLSDYPQKLRAGNPILFPIAGSVSRADASAAYKWDGEIYRLAQHGFARHLPWRVVAQTPSSLTCSLGSTALTRGMFPWDFEVQQSYSLERGELLCSATISNLSDTPMPAHFGWHPYFHLDSPQGAYFIRVPEAASVRLASDPTSEPVKPESKVILLTTALARTRFYEGVPSPSLFELVHRASGASITVRSDSTEFSNWAIWSADRHAPYVCIEPWTAAPNALNTGTGLPMIAPKACLTLSMLIGSTPI